MFFDSWNKCEQFNLSSKAGLDASNPPLRRDAAKRRPLALRLVSTVKSLHIVFLSLLAISGCVQNDNFLVGSWVIDGERTLYELRGAESPPRDILICYENYVCGFEEKEYIFTKTNHHIEYGDTRFRSTNPAEYEYELVNKNEMLYKPLTNGSQEIIKAVKLNDDLIYMEIQYDNRKYNEYYKRK